MPRKLTHEEFLNKFYKQNKYAQDIEVLGTYKNRNTKILCKCKVCGHEWETTPGILLNGHGCSICGYKRNTQRRTTTHEEFINRLQQVNSNIEILKPYINSQTKIKCRCKIDGHIWETRPATLLQGIGCPKCAGNIKLTHEEFMEKFYKQNKHAHDIEIIGTYINNSTKILCRCKIDGYEWEAKPNNLLEGNTGCAKCAGRIKKTHEEFIVELHEVNPNIEVLGTYKNNKTKIKCKCKIDGCEWSPTPSDLLHGTGCPKCAGNTKLTHKEFIKRLQQINLDIEVLGTYISSATKILCRCRKDGYEWEVAPNTLLGGHGCPKCNISKGEKRIAQYLDDLGIDYIYNMCYFNDLVGAGGGLMRPDFIIPSLKIWIEFDGAQHFKPVDFAGNISKQQIQANFKLVQQNDQIKDQYAKDNNWTLIRIPYTEYDNIEQILAAYIAQEQVI